MGGSKVATAICFRLGLSVSNKTDAKIRPDSSLNAFFVAK